MRVFLSNLASSGYAGTEQELVFNRDADGNILSARGSIAEQLKKATGGIEGQHLFGVALNGGEHSVIIGVNINADGNASYSFFDNDQNPPPVTSDGRKLDGKIFGWVTQGLENQQNKTYFRELLNKNVSSSSDQPAAHPEKTVKDN